MSEPGVVGEVTPKLPVFIVTVRFAEVPVKVPLPIDVTESGMFMDVKSVQLEKEPEPIDVTELPIDTDVNTEQ